MPGNGNSPSVVRITFGTLSVGGVIAAFTYLSTNVASPTDIKILEGVDASLIEKDRELEGGLKELAKDHAIHKASEAHPVAKDRMLKVVSEVESIKENMDKDEDRYLELFRRSDERIREVEDGFLEQRVILKGIAEDVKKLENDQ